MKNTPNYKPPEGPETPYQVAKAVHDSRLGLAVKKAIKYELVTIVLSILLFFCIVALVIISGRSSVKPYVVQIKVDGLGQILSVGDMNDYHESSDKEFKYFIGRFVKDVRTISSDKIIIKDNWLRAYDCVTQKGNGILSTYAKQNNPFGLVGKLTVSVDINTINKITRNSYQVEWTERVFNYSGKSGQKYFSGVFTVKNLPPKETNLMSNPLGIYIDEMQWSEKL